MTTIRSMSRRRVAEMDPPAGTALVSLHSRGDSPPWSLPAFAHRLAIECDDDCWPGWETRDVVLSAADADRLVAFYEKHADAPLFVIHCDVGASRSVSAALALALCYGASYEQGGMHRPLDRIPNQGVFLRVCAAVARRRRLIVPQVADARR